MRGRTRFHKTVHFYLMRAVGGDLHDHDHEFDEVAWFPADEARSLMTHATERTVLEEALRILSERETASATAQATSQ